MEVSLIQQFAVVLSITSLLMFLTYLPNNKHIPGVKSWALALCFFPIAHLLFLQGQSVSPFWSGFMANLLLSTMLTLITIGTRAFYGLVKNNLAIAVYMYSGLMVITSYFTFYAPDIMMRQVLLSLLAVSCIIIMIFSLVNVKHHQGKAKNWLLTLCIGICILLFVRIYMKLNFSAHELQTEQKLLHQSVELIMLLIGFLFAIAFSFLCQERYTKYRRAIAVKHNNDMELKTLYMHTIKQEVNTPIQAVINAIKKHPSKSQPEVSTHCEELNRISAEIFPQAPTNKYNSESYQQVSYVKLEPWLNKIFSSLQALATEKQIILSLNFIDPVGPCYLLDKYKLRLILVNLITQIINIKSSGVIKLTVHITQATSVREAANICFDFSEPKVDQDHDNNAIHKEVFTKNFGSQFSERIINSLGSELTFFMDSDNINHIAFDISTSEGLDNDIRYQIPRYNIPPVSNLEVLLVSSCQHTQAEVTESLNQNSHYLNIAQDLDDMRNRLASTKYDVLILDINADNFDPLSVPNVLEKHCQHNNNVPIIALTSNLSPAAKVALNNEGLTTLVAKPLQDSSLQRAINSLVTTKKKPLATQQANVVTPAQEAAPLSEETPLSEVTSLPEAIEIEPAPQMPDDESSKPKTQLPRYIQQRKNQPSPSSDVAEVIALNTNALFNPNALPLLARHSDGACVKETVKSINRELNELLVQFKQYLRERNQLRLQQTLYKLAISSDKLGYVQLAEQLLTTDIDSIMNSSEKEFLKFEKLLLQSQSLLAEHIKTLS